MQEGLNKGKTKMKLLIDIGNTNTSLAVLDKGNIISRYFIRTERPQVEPVKLRRLLSSYAGKIEEIYVVSVVPRFLTTIRKSLKAVMPKASVFVIGKDIIVPIEIKYKDPLEVGQDRLVASFAARAHFGDNILIIDFGTAVTFDFVNKAGEYEGGLIFPGLRVALESLVKSTALLPSIEVKAAKGFIGHDTKESMNKGVIFGYASLCDGMITHFRKKYGSKIKVVATGGDAMLISKYSKYMSEVRKDLIFTGLDILSKS